MADDHFATPQEAEEAFYAAFAQGDLGAMARVWAEDDSVVCVHPGGDCWRGREGVLESWRQIFAGGGPLRFEVEAVSLVHDKALAVHCLYESIAHGPRLEHRARAFATNAYRLTQSGWRMILHHASPSDVEEETGMEPTIETLESRIAVSTRCPVKMQEIGEKIGQLMPSIMAVAQDAVAGPVFARWHGWDVETGEGDMELGVPVSRAVEGGHAPRERRPSSPESRARGSRSPRARYLARVRAEGDRPLAGAPEMAQAGSCFASSPKWPGKARDSAPSPK